MRRGLTASLISCLNNRKDGLVTIDDLKVALPDWQHSQIMQAMANLLNEKFSRTSVPGLRKIQTGVWCLDKSSETTPKREKDPLDGMYDMIIVVIKGNDDGSELVAVDPFTNIWRMVKVG
jgi:hypothetical protein